MRDITDRHAAEQKLIESEGQLQTIFNEAPDALIVIDDQQNIIRWNPKAEEVFGWTLDEVLGKLWRLFLNNREKSLAKASKILFQLAKVQSFIKQ
jgi:PAS domain S-box-containing protein